MTTYQRYRMLRRNVLAVPTRPRGLRAKAMRRFQPVTPRRAAYRRAMFLAMATRLDRLLSERVTNPLYPEWTLDFSAWMDQVRSELRMPELNAAVFWPPQPDRGRVYVHLFDRRHAPVGFVKLSRDASNNRRLEREAHVLEELTRRGLELFHTPRVLGRGAHDGHGYLVLEPIPASARPIPVNDEAFPRSCVTAYQRKPRHIAAEALDACSWWRAYRDGLDRECVAFDEVLASQMSGHARASAVEVGFAHGDLGPSNIVRDGERLWIFDWEESCDDAPLLADEIGFDLVLRTRRTHADPAAMLAWFRKRYLDQAGPSRTLAVLLALAFRASSGIDDALLLMRHWGRASS